MSDRASCRRPPAGDVRTTNRSGKPDANKPDANRKSMTRAILSVKMNGWNPATIVYQQRRFQ
jgi:hypothetical protein